MKEVLEKEIQRFRKKIESLYNNPSFTTISGDLTPAGMGYEHYFKGKIAGLEFAIKLLERND